MENIGLFGGTFDPIHIGHLKIAEQFVQLCDLDVCYFIPTKKSPFKIDKKDMFSDFERCKKIEDAIYNSDGNSDKFSNDKFKLSDYELKKDGISYTIHTVEHFAELYHSKNLYLLIGSDQAIRFHLWKDYQRILEFVTVVVAMRPEGISEAEIALIKNNITQDKLLWLNNSIINITSSEIRKQINNLKNE